jgi:hypothetical protein
MSIKYFSGKIKHISPCYKKIKSFRFLAKSGGQNFDHPQHWLARGREREEEGGAKLSKTARIRPDSEAAVDRGGGYLILVYLIDWCIYIGSILPPQPPAN